MERRREEWKCKILEGRGHVPGHSTHWPSSRRFITAVIPGESGFLSIIYNLGTSVRTLLSESAVQDCTTRLHMDLGAIVVQRPINRSQLSLAVV